MIVADTNLVAYLLLPGSRVHAARAAHQRDAHWVVPPLWRSEFRNVLVLHVRQGVITRGEACAAWALALDVVREAEPDAVRVLDAALDWGLSAYDAEFVVLGEALTVRLVTDDRRVLAACPSLAVSIDAFVAGA